MAAAPATTSLSSSGSLPYRKRPMQVGMRCRTGSSDLRSIATRRGVAASRSIGPAPCLSLVVLMVAASRELLATSPCVCGIVEHSLPSLGADRSRSYPPLAVCGSPRRRARRRHGPATPKARRCPRREDVTRQADGAPTTSARVAHTKRSTVAAADRASLGQACARQHFVGAGLPGGRQRAIDRGSLRPRRVIRKRRPTAPVFVARISSTVPIGSLRRRKGRSRSTTPPFRET